MRRAGALLVGILLSGAASATTLPPPGQVREQIRARGAQATVESLDRNGQMDLILDLIGHGDERWIRLAPALAEGTDGADGEGLSVELARGLLIAPATVLKILILGDGTRDIDVKRVCDTPFIEPPQGHDAAYMRRATRALGRVRDPELANMKMKCLGELRS